MSIFFAALMALGGVIIEVRPFENDGVLGVDACEKSCARVMIPTGQLAKVVNSNDYYTNKVLHVGNWVAIYGLRMLPNLSRKDRDSSNLVASQWDYRVRKRNVIFRHSVSGELYCNLFCQTRPKVFEGGFANYSFAHTPKYRFLSTKSVQRYGYPWSDLVRDGIASNLVRVNRQLQGNGYDDQSQSIQKSCDNRPRSSSPSLMRCFLSSYGGAPLSAQISGIVILGMIAGIGIIAWIGREFGRWAIGGGWRWSNGRLRRWSGLLSAVAAFGLFGWWLSAA